MIDWNNGLNLGIKNLDDDHKKLLAIINKLLEALHAFKSEDAKKILFEELQKCIKVHFEKEKNLLKKYNYSKLDDNIKIYNNFNKKLTNLKKRLLASNDSNTNQEISFFLTDLFFNHIVEDNFPAINYLSNHNNTKDKNTKDSIIKKIIAKTTDKFSFAKRLFLLAVIPLIAMLILSFIIIWSNYSKYEDIRKTSSITHILSGINTLAHTMQTERGLSGGYISSSQNRFKESLHKQRKIVDKSIISFNKKFKTADKNQIISIKKFIDIFQNDIKKLNNFRQKIDTNKASQKSTITFYTKIIKNILSITSRMAMFDFNKDISSSISTLSSLLHAKEALGLKRAYGTMTIEEQDKTTDEYIKFIELIGVQEALLNNFNQTATKTQKNKLNFVMNSSINKKLYIFEKNIKNKHFKKVDSIIWFKSMTIFIDELKILEDQFLKEINILIEKSLQKNKMTLYLWSIYTILIFLITIFLIYIFEQSSKNEMFQLINAMKHLAQGKRTLRLKISANKNSEMAKIYAAYESTRQKLLKGDIYTQLYLNKKELEIKKYQKANSALEEMAFFDPLTNAVNRRKFEEISQAEFKLSIRHTRELSVLMLDLDHFKNINDTYGHAVGDEVLKHFVSICFKIARSTDIVARIGGEEFAIMLFESSSNDAFNFAERLRKEISNTELDIENNKIHYNVSIGVSSLNHKIDKNIKTILARADKALYEAKNSGRNTTKIC